MNELSVLLVEDNDDDADLTLKVLSKLQGLNVHRVKDGAEALDFLFGTSVNNATTLKENLDLVLLDLKLPKISGLEVLRKMKENEKTHSVPVVLFTSSKQESDLVNCYQSGCNSYVTKPVQFDEFRRAVNDLGVYWTEYNLVAKTKSKEDE